MSEQQEQADPGGCPCQDPAAVHVVLHVGGDPEQFEQFMASWVKDYVRRKGAGDVQQAFGFRHGGGGSGQVEFAAGGTVPEPPMTITASGGLALPAIGAGNG